MLYIFFRAAELINPCLLTIYHRERLWLCLCLEVRFSNVLSTFESHKRHGNFLNYLFVYLLWMAYDCQTSMRDFNFNATNCYLLYLQRTRHLIILSNKPYQFAFKRLKRNAATEKHNLYRIKM